MLNLDNYLKKVSLTGNFVATAIGLIVIAGWIFDVQVLKSVLPQFISMKFNTAFSFAALGIANLIVTLYPTRKISRTLSFVVSFFIITLCFLTLTEYQQDMNFGIDELFFKDILFGNASVRFPPGRMAPITASMFLLIALSRIMLFHMKRSLASYAQAFLIIVFIISFQAFISYFFGITYSFGLGYHTQMAFHTTVGMACLAMASLIMKPSSGWMEILSSNTAGGKLARNLIFWAVTVPPFIQWLNIMGERSGLYDDNFAGVLRVTANIVFFTTMVLKNASALHKSTLEQNKIQDEKMLMLVESKAAQSILASEEKMRAIFNASFEGIIGMDESGLITDCNQQAEKMFGWKKEDVIGKPLGTLVIPPEHRNAHDEGRKKFLATGVGNVLDRTIEVEAIRANGERFPIELSVTSIRVGGQFLFMGFVADITERKRVQKELIEARQEALNAAQAKSSFLANMSHEIRTPLNGIIGMTDLLLETPLDSAQKKYASIVQSSGTGLLAIINDILDFSKIDAGKMKFELIEFNPTILVEEQTELMSAKAAEKKIPLLSYVVSGVPQKVKGDPGRIGQVLLNLISNAIKFTSEGRILVKLGMTYTENAQAFFRFEVKDTGIGLNPHQCETLFKPFVQADSSTARKFGGTGLGLSISKQLTELMGGKIWVESVEGSGSSFCFEIPLEIVETHNHFSTESEAQEIKVVVVDDDPVAREIVCHYLKSWKMKYSDFPSANTALDWLNKNPSEASAIIIDSSMPEMTGTQMAKKLSESDELKNIPRIMISAFEKSNSNLADSHLFKMILGKPFKQSELYNSIVDVTIKNKGQVGQSQTSLKDESALSEFRILVAEDNSVNQLLVKTQLKKLGYNVNVVANGLEVLASLEKSHFDLILMDCQMPEMDGYIATQKIREMEKLTGKHITIVALTANAMKEDEEYCLSLGMDDFISKPTKKEILSQVLSKWLKTKA